ncbi:MAG: RtcB family protein [Phycisphaerae bacterium]|jgi:tRNA-splicing ligase RtcB
MGDSYAGPLEPIDACRWRIPRSYKSEMRTDGVIYADEKLMPSIREDRAPEQVANVACLPGIVGSSLAMPDIHWGYGFCIGGVAATDPEAGGVISPGGVGYDINCGVRLIRTALPASEVRPRIERLVNTLFNTIPCGVGGHGKIRFSRGELRELVTEGAPYVVSRGFGWDEDVERTEEGGCLAGARDGYISDHAYERGLEQVGTLGSGNHFVEVQVVDEIADRQVAEAFGLFAGQAVVTVHSGSRGFGYQVCEDALRELRGVPEKYGISLPDRQLVCAPVHSPEGGRYLGAMRAAANYAWCNRQLLMHLTREVFAQVFGRSAEQLEMRLVYDVAHNIAKLESYEVDGRQRQLCVHRKGATRALPAGHPDVPEVYRAVGQPVLVPGDMGRSSWVLVGQPQAMTESFGSCCHGAGRVLSRGAAIRAAKGRSIARELADVGVIAKARGRTGLAEEQPAAYKDVSQVVDVVHRAGISRKVARLRPLGVIKG